MMKYIWRALGVMLILCVIEGLYHPLGVMTDDLLRGGMVILVAFVVVTAIRSVQTGIRSHRQVASKAHKAKPSRSYAASYAGDGGYVPAVADAGCPLDTSAGSGDAGANC